MGTWNVTDQKVRLVATACNKRWDSPSGKGKGRRERQPFSDPSNE